MLMVEGGWPTTLMELSQLLTHLPNGQGDCGQQKSHLDPWDGVFFSQCLPRYNVWLGLSS